MNRVLLALLPLVVACFAHAAPPDEQLVARLAHDTLLSPQEIRTHLAGCDVGTTLTLQVCAQYRLAVADLRLNKVYAAVRDAARASGYGPELLAAQRAWLAYRDAMCVFEGRMGAGGGTAEGLYVLSCEEDLTTAQAARLEATMRP